jgi:DNA-directed RNA polymerase specialized sigma subunit
MLIDGVSDVSTENIEKYLDDSPIKFHLFAYLYEIFFRGIELKENKREVLKHRFDYSDKYEKLNDTEMAERLSITSRAVYQAEHTLERAIRDIIRVFKVFARYCQ